MAKEPNFRLVFERSSSGRALSYAKIEKAERERIVALFDYMKNSDKDRFFTGEVAKDLFVPRMSLARTITKLVGAIGVEMEDDTGKFKTIFENNGKRLLRITQETKYRLKERAEFIKFKKPLRPPTYISIP